jgi:prefoldin subunit 5
MSSKKQYEEQVAAKLKQLESEVDALRDHIKSIEHELAPEHREQFQKLQELEAATKAKFDELVESGDEVFDSMRENLEEYWSSLGREIKAFDLKIKERTGDE